MISGGPNPKDRANCSTRLSEKTSINTRRRPVRRHQPTLKSAPPPGPSKRSKSPRDQLRKSARDDLHCDQPTDAQSEEEDQDQSTDEEEEEALEPPTILNPKKVKLKLLNRMMPRVYVTKAEKDLKLMEQEKRAGKLRLTVDSDSSEPPSDLPRARKTINPRRRLSSSSSSHSSHPNSPPRAQKTIDRLNQQPEPPGLTWDAKMRLRMNRTSSSTSQLFDSRRSLERSISLVSSVSSRVSQNTPRTLVASPSRARSSDLSNSLKDDHALWKTYESANGRPALNLPPPDYRHEKRTEGIELPQVPVWKFKDFTPGFGIPRLPGGLIITSQIRYLSGGHVSEFMSLLDGTMEYTTVDSFNVFRKSFSPFMAAEDLQAGLSSVADRIQDELLAWLALDPGRSSDALTETATCFKLLSRLVSSLEFDETLIDPMIDWVCDLINRLDDLAVDAVNRPDFSNLMLVSSWGILELVSRLDIRRRRSLTWDDHRSQHDFVELGNRSISNLIRRLLEYGPPITMTRLKGFVASEENREDALFDVSLELWASLLNTILTSSINTSKPEYLMIEHFWSLLLDSTRLHARRVELSQIAYGEVLCYLTMMMSSISQISSTGVSIEEVRLPTRWSILVESLGKIPESTLGETLETRRRERRDRYVRTLFSRILIFHERWGWELKFDDGMIEKLYKILNAGRLERLSNEVGGINRFGPIDRFPHVLAELDDEELREAESIEDIVSRLRTNLRKDDTCFGIFLKVMVIGFKSLPRPIEISKLKEIEKIISRCNPLRQLSFKPIRELGPTDPSITDQRRTGLINHASLFLIYSILFPNTIKRQWSFLNSLYQFTLLDHPSRSTHLKILVKFAKLLMNKHISTLRTNSNVRIQLDILMITKQLSENFQILKLEFSKLKGRQMILNDRLATTTTSSLKHFISTSKEPFGLNFLEKSSLTLELREILRLMDSRIQLIVEIFDGLSDLIGFFSYTPDRVMDDATQLDPKPHLTYTSEDWLDPSWTIGLEESNLSHEKAVMNAFNKFLSALLTQRKITMNKISEHERRVKEIDGLLKQENSRRTLSMEAFLELDQDPDYDLMVEKQELQDMIEEAYRIDQEWILKLYSSTSNLFKKAIQISVYQEDPGHFLSVGIQLVRSLGLMDRLRAPFESSYDWIENFKLIERQFAGGLSSSPSTTDHSIHPDKPINSVSPKLLSKPSYGFQVMVISITCMMSYLISNLEDDRYDRNQEYPAELMRIYRGEVRIEILKFWMNCMTFIDFTLQFKLTVLIIRLEHLRTTQSVDRPESDSDLANDEEFLGFLPDPHAFHSWSTERFEATEFPDQLILDDRHHAWWEFEAEYKLSRRFESKRLEFFNLFLNEMRRNLSRSVETDDRYDVNPTTTTTSHRMEGERRRRRNFEDYLKFYKLLIGHWSESISNLNRRLMLLLNQRGAMDDRHDSDRATGALVLPIPPPPPNPDPSIDRSPSSLLWVPFDSSRLKRWKFMIKSIVQTHFIPPTPESTGQGLPPPRDGDHDGHDDLKLSEFINFVSLPKLRILKSIVGLV